jgi:hypothetical protein
VPALRVKGHDYHPCDEVRLTLVGKVTND